MRHHAEDRRGKSAKIRRRALFLAALLLLCSCSASNPDQFNAPNVSLGDRPGYTSLDVSDVFVEDPSYSSEASQRNMGFSETEAVGLYRVVTRTGDLSVLGITYGDGVYFSLSRRERGVFLTGYGEDRKGVFSGMLSEDYLSPMLLGYAGGFACLYCPESDLTLACRGDGSYVQLSRKDADSVWLYDGGYAMQKGNQIALYPPDKKDSIAVFTLPAGYTWVSGNETGAWVEKDGTVYLLSADGRLSGGFSSLLSVQNGGYVCKSGNYAVVLNPTQGMAYPVRSLTALLACGDDFTMEKTSAGLQITLPTDGKTALLPAGEQFAFGGRTAKGFLYKLDGVWYWFAETAMTQQTLSVLPFAPSDDPMAIAAICAKDALYLRTGKVLRTETVIRDEVSATGVSDYSILFAACGQLEELLKGATLPGDSIFLCTTINMLGMSVPFAVTDEGVFIDVSQPETLENTVSSLLGTLNKSEENEEQE